MGEGEGRRSLEEALTQREHDAATRFVRVVLREVPARLVQASLFGSKARGDDRLDSDVDVLLIFHWLPPDREPYATHAERIAERVAADTSIPVTVWSVSLPDLERGFRTPMLVDALADSIPLWAARRPVPPLPFTPEDADRCTAALLDRVAEGSVELGEHLARGDAPGAALRIRDDLVRMCTARMLLAGVTRPRRGEAVGWVLRHRSRGLGGETVRTLRWAERSFGPDGKDEEAVPPPPPLGLAAAARAVQVLREQVIGARRQNFGRAGGYGWRAP